MYVTNRVCLIIVRQMKIKRILRKVISLEGLGLFLIRSNWQLTKFTRA